MIQKHRRKQAAIVAGVGLGVAATLWGMKRWRQLKETPPVSPHSHHAGLAAPCRLDRHGVQSGGGRP